MNQKDLIYIKTIADEGGVSQAAKKLFVSQPSLSQSLKRIEDALGVPLFKRTPKGLLLTREGTEYYRMASRILNIYSTFEEELQNLRELRTGTISVGTTPHRGMFLLPEFLARFYINHPGITVSVTEENGNELEELLLNGKIDFAFMRAPTTETHSQNISYRGMLNDVFLLLLPSGHPAGAHAIQTEKARYPFLDPKWLTGENFLLPAPRTRLRETVEEILKRANISVPRSSYSCLYAETLVYLTALGQGVTIVPQRYLMENRQSLAIDCYSIPPEYGAFWEICFTSLRDTSLSKAAALFMDEFSRYLGL